jgi:TolB-like protein/Flp pilus assembly protein TadD
VTDIFLSYNREDQARAKVFAEAFAAQGFKVWWDVGLRTGEAYDEVTESALRTAKAVVVLWSKKSVQSRWVRAEATLADRNRTLVPCMIEPCERPIMFELTQTADLSHWEGETTDRVWLGFLADVARFVGRQAAATTPAASPLSAKALATATPARRAGRPSVAIMPFTNRSVDRADEVFAGGMSEDVASALSLGRGLKVIAQSATMAYRRDTSDLRRIGQELDAKYILEGNTRRVGQTLRVTAQLVEAETGAILWTQKFDRPLTELAELQEELVDEVAANLGVQIQKAEMERALKKPGDLTAWEAVMRSWAAYARQTPETMALAVAEARRAVALAPDYAVARGTLAMALALQFNATGFRDRPLIDEALAHADEAFRLNPNHPAVLFQVANTCCQVGRHDESLRHAERAVELNPNLVDARQALACALIHFERYHEALAQLAEGERIAPRTFQLAYSHGHRSWAYYGLGQVERALDGCRRFEQSNPDAYWGQLTGAVCLQALGRMSEAQDAIRRTRKARPGEPLAFWINCIRHAYLAADKRASFELHFTDAWNATPEEPSA